MATSPIPSPIRVMVPIIRAKVGSLVVPSRQRFHETQLQGFQNPTRATHCFHLGNGGVHSRLLTGGGSLIRLLWVVTPGEIPALATPRTEG